MSPCFQRYLIYMCISIGRTLPRNRQVFSKIKKGIKDIHWLQLFSSTPSSGDTSKSVCWTVGCHPYFHSVEGSLSLPAAVSDIFICLGRYLLYAGRRVKPSLLSRNTTSLHSMRSNLQVTLLAGQPALENLYQK
jgi:hypothetical protein